MSTTGSAPRVLLYMKPGCHLCEVAEADLARPFLEKWLAARHALRRGGVPVKGAQASATDDPLAA